FIGQRRFTHDSLGWQTSPSEAPCTLASDLDPVRPPYAGCLGSSVVAIVAALVLGWEHRALKPPTPPHSTLLGPLAPAVCRSGSLVERTRSEGVPAQNPQKGRPVSASIRGGRESRSDDPGGVAEHGAEGMVHFATPRPWR